MKYFLLLGIALIMSCSAPSTEKQPDISYTEPDTAKIRAAKESFGSSDKILNLIKEEPKCKDAFITDSKVLYFSLVDDGTNRNGFAEYLCQLIKDEGGSSYIDRVKIVKHNSSTDPNRDNAYGVLLGECYCK
jgi:hypothetical protein